MNTPFEKLPRKVMTHVICLHICILSCQVLTQHSSLDAASASQAVSEVLSAHSIFKHCLPDDMA
jgi:hypothetical protein